MLKCIQKMLIFVMICVLVPVNIAFSENDYLDGKTFKEAVEILQALEIIDYSDDETTVDESVTRAEFSVMLSKLLGYDDILDASYVNPFVDVADDHVANKAISLMSELGIAGGFANGRFYPDEPIIFEHAVKMTVCALGYDVLANRKGGETANFLSIAHQIDLLDSIEIKGGSVLPKGVAAQLIYNSLFVDLIEQSNYGENFSYEIKKGVNLLSEKYKTVKKKGNITATEFTSLFDKNGAGEGNVIIGEEKYKSGIISIEKWLGHEVEFYARYYDGFENAGTVIYAVPTAKIEDVIVVEAENICPETTDDNFVYYELPSYKQTEKNIKNAYVIFNGQAASNYCDADFRPESGSVTLIDTDSNGDYDVVSIVSYDVCVINSATSNKITFKYGKSEINLDPKDKKIEYKFIKDGQEIDYIEVLEWNVCSVKQTKDGKRYEFYISDAKISGLVKQISDDFVVIGENEYPKGESYKKALEDSEITVIKPEVGEDFTLYLDFFGYIAGSRKESAPMLGEGYGYVLKAEQETKGFNKGMIFRILTGEIGCNIQKFKGAEKMKVNGEVIEKLSDSAELFDTSEGQVKKQLIIYELNDAGEITEIHTAKDKFHETVDGLPNPDYDASYAGYSEEEFTLDYAFDRAPYRVGANRSFHYNKFRVYTNSLVFIIPNVDEPLDEECRVTTASAYLKSDTYYSNVTLYDTTSDYDVSVMVELVGSNAAFGFDTIDDGEQIAVVDKITTAINSEGIEVPKFNGYYSGSYVSYPAYSEELKDSGVWDDEKYGLSFNGKKLTDLPRGSILQMQVNARNDIVQMRVLFIPKEGQMFFEKNTGDFGVHDAGGRLYTAYGRIIKRLPDGVVYNARPHWNTETARPGDDRTLDGSDREWDRNVITSAADVYVYDREKDTLEKVAFTEINDGDTVLLHKSTGGVRNIVVYR